MPHVGDEGPCAASVTRGRALSAEKPWEREWWGSQGPGTPSPGPAVLNVPSTPWLLHTQVTWGKSRSVWGVFYPPPP